MQTTWERKELVTKAFFFLILKGFQLPEIVSENLHCRMVGDTNT